MPFTPLLAMIRKDLLLFFSDRRSVIVSFAVPIAIASFFGYVFSSMGNATQRARVTVAVIDRDASAISKNIVSSVQGDPNLRVTTPIEEDARDAVRTGRLAVSVIIPKNFGDESGRAFFGGGVKPTVGFVYDPSRATELAMVRGIMTQHIMEAVSRDMFGGATGRQYLADALPQIESSALPQPQKQALLQLLRSAQALSNQTGTTNTRAPGLTIPYEVREEAMTGSSTQYNGYAHSFGGMAIQFLLFAMANLGVEMLLERQRGLWQRLRSAPVSRFMLLTGKAVSGAIISFLILAVCFAFAMLVFRVRIQGSVVGFLGVTLASSVMASTFGLLVAALGNSPATARGVTTLAVLMMVMLGGAWVPTFIFPAWLQSLTVIVPVRWAVDGLDATTWRGVGLSGTVAPIAILLAFAVAFGTVAASRFRWDEA